MQNKIREILHNKIRVNPNEVLTQIDILDYAINKAYAFANITSDIVGHPIECCGYLISPKFDYSGVVQDVCLAKKQEVSESRCKLNIDAIYDSIDAINSIGHKLNGAWHNHGSNGVFHSHIDIPQFDAIMHECFVNNIKEIGKKKKYLAEQPYHTKITTINGKKYYEISTKDIPRKTIYISGDNLSKEFKLTEIFEETPNGIRHAYGIVINNLGDKKYTVLAYKDPNNSEAVLTENVPLNIISTGRKVNTSELENIVKNNVIYNGRYLREYSPINSHQVVYIPPNVKPRGKKRGKRKLRDRFSKLVKSRF